MRATRQPRYNQHMPIERRRPDRLSGVDEVVDRLFVYGTLRTGQAARSLVGNHVKRWKPATTRGTMYAFPMGYPGLTDGEGDVSGELLWLSELAAALPLLDAYEGEDFTRVLRAVTLEDGSAVSAWCYVLTDPGSVAHAEAVLDGDWVRYRSALGG